MSWIGACKDPCGSAWRWIRDRNFFAPLRDSPWLVRLRSGPAFNPKCLVALLVPLLIVAGYFFYWWLPTPNVRIVLHASTEVVRFQVANPDLAAFRVAGMRAFAEDSSTGDCVTGVVQPAIGVTVSYAITTTGKPVVGLSLPVGAATQPVAQYSDSDDRVRPLNGFHRIVADDGCPGNPPQRFPILGNAEFGREYSAPTATADPMQGVLSNAKLTIYGQSLRFEPLSYPSIYEWKKIDVPGGARLGAISDTGDGAEPVWRGLARFGFDKDISRASYSIDASTNARGIRLTIPGVEDQDSQIVFDKFSPLTSDPNWIALQLYVGIGIWLIVKFFEFWSWLGKRSALKNATD
jgi:hypothetical protein